MDTIRRLIFNILTTTVDIPFAQLASNTVGVLVADNVRAVLQSEISRFRKFTTDKKQLLDKLRWIRDFLEHARRVQQQNPDEPTLEWIREIEKRVSDAEAALRQIGEDDPSWLKYRRGHAILVEEHSEKLDEITKIGTGFYFRLHRPVYVMNSSPVDTTTVINDAVAVDDRIRRAKVYAPGGFAKVYKSVVGFDSPRVFLDFDGSVHGFKVPGVIEKLDEPVDGLKIPGVFENSDGDGKVSAEELRAALRPFEELDARALKKKQMMGTMGEYRVEELERVFGAFDANGDGKISFAELTETFKALRSETTFEQLKMMMDEIDADGDGFIDVHEFAEYYIRGFNESKEVKMLSKILGKKRSLVDGSSSSMIHSGDAGTDGKMKKMRTELKA